MAERHGSREGAGKDPCEESAAWPPATDEHEPPAPVERTEAWYLEAGEMRRCLYCRSMCGHKPGCRGEDIHPECPYCFNVCGHKSSTCPGRYL